MIELVKKYEVYKEKIWDENNNLFPLKKFFQKKNEKDVAVIIVTRNRPNLANGIYEQVSKMGEGLSKDIFIIEMGSEFDKMSKYASFYYPDEDFRGKCYGHNVGLRFSLLQSQYKYFWFLMNDLVFSPSQDVVKEFYEFMEKNKDIAIVSPTEIESKYPASNPHKNKEYHLVSTTDYLALFIRGDAIKNHGFLNPQFKYSWGAIHELAYKYYSNGFKIAYHDRIIMKHLGGTTYGKAKGTISRQEYIKNAKKFAAEYFIKTYGKEWDDLFSKSLPPEIELNTFKLHRKYWEGVFNKNE